MGREHVADPVDSPAFAKRPSWAWSIAESLRAQHEGRVRAADLVDACIERIGQVDAAIHSYIHVDREAARQQGRSQAARGRATADAPLAGIPFAVKATYDVAGMPSSAGSRMRIDRIAPGDAALVARARAAGAICLGLLNTWEYGTGNGGEYFDLPYPPARNPWDTTRFTGGSSSGCGTAVAAGTAMFALGSDTTGSVRLPAAATGVVGFIPTPGRYSLEGILPNCHTLDVPGTFTRTVDDARRLFAALSDAAPYPAADRDDAAHPAGLAGLRIGIVRDPGPGMPQPAAALAAGFEEGLKVLERLGATLVDMRLPVAVAECFAVTRLIGPVESAAIHEQELRQSPALLGYALRDKLLAGSLVPAVDYVAALRRKAVIAGEIDRLFDQVDLLLCFGALNLPPRLGVEPEMTAFTVETMLTPFNLSGHPAMVQCTGYSAQGLPLHWQVVGRRGRETDVFRVGIAYENQTHWRERLPRIVRHEPSAAEFESGHRAAPAQRDERESQVDQTLRTDTGLEEAERYARRHGIHRLAPEHLARMRDLFEPVARFGFAIDRVSDKFQTATDRHRQIHTTNLTEDGHAE